MLFSFPHLAVFYFFIFQKWYDMASSYSKRPIQGRGVAAAEKHDHVTRLVPRPAYVRINITWRDSVTPLHIQITGT